MDTRRSFLLKVGAAMIGSTVKTAPLKFLCPSNLVDVDIAFFESETISLIYGFENLSIFAASNIGGIDTTEIEELMSLERYSFDAAFEEAIRRESENIVSQNAVLADATKEYLKTRQLVGANLNEERKARLLDRISKIYGDGESTLHIEEARKIILGDDTDLTRMQEELFVRAKTSMAKQHAELRVNKENIRQQVTQEIIKFTEPVGIRFLANNKGKFEIQVKSRKNTWLEAVTKNRTIAELDRGCEQYWRESYKRGYDSDYSRSEY